MTNEEFQEKFEKLKKERLPMAGLKGVQLTINEIIFILREDDEVNDYLLNFNTKDGFAFGFLKKSYFPTRDLVLKVKSITYEWPEGSEIPTLYLEIKK